MRRRSNSDLRNEIDQLRGRVAELEGVVAELHLDRRSHVAGWSSLEEPDEEEQARAFAEFYAAYDEVHAKTRTFLLG